MPEVSINDANKVILEKIVEKRGSANSESRLSNKFVELERSGSLNSEFQLPNHNIGRSKECKDSPLVILQDNFTTLKIC